MLLSLLTLAAADPMAEVRVKEAVLARVGYRLASRSAAFCNGNGRPTGMIVERLSQYPVADRAAMTAAGLGPWPAVVLLVPDSPAAAAGLRPGDQIVAIDGAAIAPEDAKAPADANAGVAFDARLAEALTDGAAALTVRRAGQPMSVALSVSPGCASRFTLRLSDKLASYADGTTVQINWGVVTRAKSDAELAPVVAHELAHNILRHPQTLKPLGWPRGKVFATELAADRLSIYLLYAAGYPYPETSRFMTDFLRAIDWGILSDRTHPGWRQRVAAMAAERARIDAQLARGEPVRPPPDLVP